MFLMVVFAASVRALVTPVTIRTSIAGHHASRVARSRSVSAMSATATTAVRTCIASAAWCRLALVSRMRRCSLTAQAHSSCPVGSSWSNTASSRVQARAVRVSAPRSSSRRFAQAGSLPRPRRWWRSRTSRRRTSVTIWLARATRWKVSTLTAAAGRCSRRALRNAAEGGGHLPLAGVDRDDLDPLAPSGCPRGEPGAHTGAVAPVYHAQDLPGVQVDERGHPPPQAGGAPRLEPPPPAVGVTEEPHRPVPVLVDAQPAHHDVVHG